jgi:hypothetical protein
VRLPPSAFEPPGDYGPFERHNEHALRRQLHIGQVRGPTRVGFHGTDLRAVQMRPMLLNCPACESRFELTDDSY